jgi:tRNA(fMet)-specific endonuclease VapC
MTYLLDTNICIALINDRSAEVRAAATRVLVSGSVLATSSIVIHELWYGVAKSTQVESNTDVLSAFLARDLTILDYTEVDAKAAAQIRAELERKGTRIGEYDTLIAGQALVRQMTLVTANTREFSRVPGLQVEDWTQ